MLGWKRIDGSCTIEGKVMAALDELAPMQQHIADICRQSRDGKLIACRYQ